MQTDFRIRAKFWGERGSIPTPMQENLGYGGNTTCVEIRSGSDILIIDGGTGVRQLGLSLIQEFTSCKLHFLTTHFHWDHIQGLPFFAPLFSPSNEVTFHSRHAPTQIEEILEGQMTQPYFPVDFHFLAAKRHFAGLTSEPHRHGSLSVQAFPMNHPQGASGYRIERDGAVIVHASDLEHGDPRFDRILRDHAQDADILIMDAQYTPDEYATKKGWGHSTWLEATRVARDSNVKQLVLFHHDPSRSDHAMDQIVSDARCEFENTVAARELAEVSI